jgi:hypothetical protein
MNGGLLERRCFPSPLATSWADDHFEIGALGIGGEYGIDGDNGYGSAYLVAKWDCSDIGYGALLVVVIRGGCGGVGERSWLFRSSGV